MTDQTTGPVRYWGGQGNCLCIMLTRVEMAGSCLSCGYARKRASAWCTKISTIV